MPQVSVLNQLADRFYKNLYPNLALVRLYKLLLSLLKRKVFDSYLTMKHRVTAVPYLSELNPRMQIRIRKNDDILNHFNSFVPDEWLQLKRLLSSFCINCTDPLRLH